MKHDEDNPACSHVRDPACQHLSRSSRSSRTEAAAALQTVLGWTTGDIYYVSEKYQT